MTQDLQKMWDAHLILGWRKCWSIAELFNNFNTATGVNVEEVDLLRKPRLGFPYKVSVRVFAANHLEKISNRLFDQTPDKDVLLLNKLQASKYTTSEKSTLTKDNGLAKATKNTKINTEKLVYETRNYRNRNHKTDWSVTK